MRDFLIDTGLLKLSQDDKDYIIKTLIRDIWELHDNGNLHFDFSDEMIEENFDYMRLFTYKDSEKILKEKNERD